MTAFAATSYTTTNESVTNVTSAITADADTNQVDVRVTQGSTFSVTIPKTIVLAGATNTDNQATYKVTVSGNIASNETINVVPSDSGKDAEGNPTFSMSDTKRVKSDLTATIEQTVTKFVDKQVTTDTTDTAKLETQEKGDDSKTIEGTVTIANLTSGSWSGNFNFAISLSAS
jgi:hypothetical protein